MSYNSSVLATRDMLRNMVVQLDVVVDTMTTAATEYDAEYPPIGGTKHRQLVDAFRQLATARAALVNAHSEISGTVPGHVTQEAPIR